MGQLDQHGNGLNDETHRDPRHPVVPVAWSRGLVGVRLTKCIGLIVMLVASLLESSCGGYGTPVPADFYFRAAGDLMSALQDVPTETRQEAQQHERKEEAEDLASLLARAESGDAEAQYQLYLAGERDRVSLRWVCLAANSGHALAQEEFGDIHAAPIRQEWRDLGLAEYDRTLGYLWYSLAGSNGLKRGEFLRDRLRDQMTSAEIAEAERLVSEWKPDPDSCEFEARPRQAAG